MSELRYAATTRADTETTWRILTDHAGMAEWSSQVFRSRLVSAGEPPPDGTGAVRRLLSLAGPVTEQVTAFEPPRRLAYRMTAGAPIVADYHAIVELVPGEGGTRISWTLRFAPRPAPLAGLIEWFVRRATNRFALDVAAAADRARPSARGNQD